MPEEMAMARQEALPPVAVDDELPDLGPVSPNTLAVHTSTSGAYDIRIPLHISPQLAEPAVSHFAQPKSFPLLFSFSLLII